MDSKVNFTLVGVFLFVFILGVIGFTFWLGKYGLDTKKVDLYKIYLEESVAGLNIESAIKYKGLNVGAVKQIKIDPNNSEQIEILVEINEGTPIKEDTVAVLESQGITGLKFINLTGGLKDSPLLLSNENTIPTIESKKSFFGSLGDSAEDITVKVNTLLDRLNYILNEKNIQELSGLLENTNSVAKNLDNAIVVLDDQVIKAMNTLDGTLLKIQELINKDTKDTISEIGAASLSAQKTFQALTHEIESGKFDIKEITADSLKRFDKLMLEFDRTMRSAEKMIDKYSDSPSDIIFKSRSDNFGPGEKQ
jgi:phospholipid/cholesterol/gamma-HCH transport system substrate-binding protein